MALTLSIENFTSLPDGGPLSYTVSGARGFDLGRDMHLDWTLPDPTRYISGKHCEVRYQDGDYVLYDVSTNGTFLNGSDRRMHGPHVLCNGDRILIGNYIVVAQVDAPRRSVHAPPPVAPAPFGADIWEAEGAAPPASRSEIVVRPAHAPVQPDFLDWAAELPHAELPRAEPAAGVPSHRTPPQIPPEPRPAAVEPSRRAIWVDSSPTGAWALSDPAPMAPPREPEPPHEPPHEPPPAPSVRVAAPEPPRRDPAPGADGRWADERAATPAAGPGPAAAPTGAQPPSAQEAIAALARGAGMPVEAFSRRDSIEMLEEVGATLRVAAEHMMKLLQARASIKRSIRSSEHTMIGALDNNPFKFSPTPEDCLRIAFGPPTRSYLNGRKAFERGFDDIANHQLRVFTAMQQALKLLVEDLDPASIEAELGPDKGMAALLASRKGRLWELYAATWRAKTQRNEDGMVGLFLSYFAECYDKLGQRGRDDR
ncbi:type VI secretion system-associated FHA domain protein TagH [Xanthobacter sp. AM11]|uniref:type VI secretion system-associated FHA domain protein TagH n=1 Tax=Xanthobacter sp. AM11 TaxID=3380643 RepID=UPI0039BF2FD9